MSSLAGNEPTLPSDTILRGMSITVTRASEMLTYESFSTLILRTSPLGNLNKTVCLELIVPFLAPWVGAGVPSPALMFSWS